MNKGILSSLLLVVSLAACGGGAGSALPMTGQLSSGASQASTSPQATATPIAASQASGRIAFGNPIFSTPTFNSTTENESGTCGTSLQFTGAQSDFLSEYATLAVSEQGYSGAFSVSESFGSAPGNGGLSSPSQAVAASVSRNTLTVTAISAGLVNVTVSDSLGHSATCAVAVTTTTATVQ